MKLTYDQLKMILDLASNAAHEAANLKMEQLKGTVKYIVRDDATGQVQGTMSDLCGFANCFIPKRILSTRSKAVKQLIAEQRVSVWEYQRALNVRLAIPSQYMSVNEAAAQAAVDVLKAHGIDAYMDSRLD